MNAAGHYLLALAVMAALAAVMLRVGRSARGGQGDVTRNFGGCCRGFDCRCRDNNDPARDS